ncbi:MULTISPECIES: dipeptidyl-peptidase 3 family protein [Bacteroides]|jgi:dipeptidyl-peptidase-3|uniref:Dihydrofolate reductase n=3 Tax=Bacteroides uniformis TaxID=820 RepID=A0A413N5C1_BACUN|nr:MULTISPECIES: dihydrofolate reductase [Bacteroides]MBP9766542.1 dihydrofolate reductase [Bacteroides sp.]CUO38562.1 Peptidase family M49 [Catenibacterium mitsuokai]KAB4212182.1 dihydrofolate reductase [Bacteroides uniformis]KAB4214487.1 dihydrofolate reductase [Bacteroides uniformis]MBT8722985.1 dihydrofolate reductase [Bacteroides uniformis]
MKKQLISMVTALSLLTACGGNPKTTAEAEKFDYTVEQFADLQILRYRVPGFEDLSLKQKELVYYLTEAALQGRDILFDQNGKYNLTIRRMLEAVYTGYKGDKNTPDFKAMEVYLKRVWFSNGIHHHYGSEKFVPGFTPEFFRQAVQSVDAATLPLAEGQTVEQLCEEVFPVIFDPTVMPKRVNQAAGEDLVLTSACNYYDGVTQQEAEDFYNALKNPQDETPVSYGLNSRLVKEDGKIQEKVWKVGGLYGQALEKIVYWLKKAEGVAETPEQKAVIAKLMEFYETGDLKTFDEYAILWVKDLNSRIDFVNGFTESYGDPLGMKASWESLVNFKDLEATQRTELISGNAQWFEDHSPVDGQFKKEKVKGVSAKVITAAILAGDLYPATAIGINLPNANWIRSHHGSKSVTIGNITDAYNKAAHGNGFNEEFVYSDAELQLIDKYADVTDELHTDLHECLGHGSGKLLPGVDPDALKAYGSTIEEARADLFGLYYVADPKLVELGLTPSADAYKAQYYTYLMNGLMTQLVRIEPGNNVEEAHMRNRQLIARWVYEKGAAEKVVELVKKDGKTYVVINDYEKVRDLFGRLLAEIQRIKSTGDYAGAHDLVEAYAVKVDPALHAEVLERYKKLNLAPYKGFVNPKYEVVTDADGTITDVTVTYDEGYAEQMLRYSKDYSTLSSVNK